MGGIIGTIAFFRKHIAAGSKEVGTVIMPVHRSEIGIVLIIGKVVVAEKERSVGIGTAVGVKIHDERSFRNSAEFGDLAVSSEAVFFTGGIGICLIGGIVVTVSAGSRFAIRNIAAERETGADKNSAALITGLTGIDDFFQLIVPGVVAVPLTVGDVVIISLTV